METLNLHFLLGDFCKYDPHLGLGKGGLSRNVFNLSNGSNCRILICFVLSLREIKITIYSQIKKKQQNIGICNAHWVTKSHVDLNYL